MTEQGIESNKHDFTILLTDWPRERQHNVTTTLYDLDFYSWALHQATLLRNEEYADLDRDNLIEEIEDMARRHRDALESHLLVLLRHLLKISCLPTSNPSRGWRLTIKEQRYQIVRLLKNNPSLRRFVPDMIDDLYAQARDLATDDLANDELRGQTLPVGCPWTPEQILDLNWLP
ncbi:MAG: DUF29 domain-containing protein [Caldilineaceae bacterium]